MNKASQPEQHTKQASRGLRRAPVFPLRLSDVERTAAERVTPPGFARAFFEANP